MKKYLLIIISLSVITSIKAQVKTAVQDTAIYETVETSAEFPGGLGEFYKFIGVNLVYPESAKKTGAKGRIFINFVVEKDGALSNYKVLRGLAPDIDAEVMRVIKMAPKWIPAKQGPTIVRQLFSIPINLSIEKELTPANTRYIDPKIDLSDTTVYIKVELSGEYPGGPENFDRYIKAFLITPKSLKDAKIKGEVIISFIIEKSGLRTDLHVDKTLTPEADAEALRLIKVSKPWKPGEINNKYVRQKYSVSIDF